MSPLFLGPTGLPVYNQLETGVSLETRTDGKVGEISDDSVRHMLILAERLREQSGGELDDAAIMAVAEATNTTPDYVRLAVRLLPENKKQGLFHRIRNAILTLEPDVRGYVISTLLAANCALMHIFESGFKNAFFGTVFLISLGIAVWNISMSKDRRVGAVSGAIFGGAYFVAESLFSFLIHFLHVDTPSTNSLLLIPFVVGGAVFGALMQAVISSFHSKLGIKDPKEERQELLRQLVDLQDKLRSGEQSMTFLSLDIVGSTRMKQSSDPLSVEFTFTEYHNFVDAITRKHGGRVHSTAGDGVTCAFEHPQQAFAAARNIQTGLVELNTFRNKIGVPIVLRAGIHSGAVVAPKPGDIQSLNFAHVIDIAAHLQKECPPGGIAVSAAATQLVTGGAANIGSHVISWQDVQAYVWMPRHQLVALPNPSAPQV